MNPYLLTLDSLRAWCERGNVRAFVNVELGQLAIPRPEDQNHLLRVIFRPERNMATFALPYRFAVPKDRAAEFDLAVALANSASFMGAYVHNHQLSEAYFRVTVPTGGVGYTDDAITWLLRLVIGSHDALEKPLRAVALEGAPGTAVLPPGGAPPAA
jgi:hypothetical protein